MDCLEEKLQKFTEKFNYFLFLYQQLKEENILLKDKINLLEARMSELTEALQFKKIQLGEKDEESLFFSMLIDDLINDLGRIDLSMEGNNYSQKFIIPSQEEALA